MVIRKLALLWLVCIASCLNIFAQTNSGTGFLFQLPGTDGGNHMLEYVKELVATGEYPELAKLSGGDLDSLWAKIFAHATDDTRFDRNLARLLDGIARDLHTA